jgi:hypothetical protein
VTRTAIADFCEVVIGTTRTARDEEYSNQIGKRPDAGCQHSTQSSVQGCSEVQRHASVHVPVLMTEA